MRAVLISGSSPTINIECASIKLHSISRVVPGSVLCTGYLHGLGKLAEEVVVHRFRLHRSGRCRCKSYAIAFRQTSSSGQVVEWLSGCYYSSKQALHENWTVDLPAVYDAWQAGVDSGPDPAKRGTELFGIFSTCAVRPCRTHFEKAGLKSNRTGRIFPNSTTRLLNYLTRSEVWR